MKVGLDTIFARTLALVLSGTVATLALGLGVLALLPPPAPESVSIAWYVRAYQTGMDAKVAAEIVEAAAGGRRSHGRADALIAASLAGGIGVRRDAVHVSIEAPALFGVVPGSIRGDRGHMTIIDVPRPASLPVRGRRIDLDGYLRDGAVRVPPFEAIVQRADGSYVRLEPRSPFPTAWQTRVLIIFALSIAVSTPLAWIGVRRLTRSVDLLARRVDRTEGHEPEVVFPGMSGPCEVRRLERAFAALYARTQQHVAERTRLLQAVVHDLRTPLTTMRIRVEQTSEPVRTGLRGDVARIDRMTADVLAFARAASIRRSRQMVDVGLIVADVADAARVCGAAVFLDGEASGGPPIPRITGDPTEIARAIDNLVRNAIRHGDRTTISLRVELDQVVIAVSDDGPGVPEDALTRLVEPFYRLERDATSASDGFGLGLATVDAIVRAHGGAVTFRNLAPGFRATIVLPRSDPPDN